MEVVRNGVSARRALSLAAWSVVALPALLVGCEPAVRAPVEVTANSETPEGQLKNVMRRLKFALKNAQPDADSGVVSHRVASYRLIPPAEEPDSLTAEVTIKTSTELAPAEVARIKQTGSEDGGPQVAADKVVEAAETSEKKVYSLTYKDNRWELAEPPMKKLSKTEKIIFQYALSDG